MDDDRLAKLKRDDDLGLEIGRSDFDWLVSEVERYRSDLHWLLGVARNGDYPALERQIRNLMAAHRA